MGILLLFLYSVRFRIEGVNTTHFLFITVTCITSRWKSNTRCGNDCRVSFLMETSTSRSSWTTNWQIFKNAIRRSKFCPSSRFKGLSGGTGMWVGFRIVLLDTLESCSSIQVVLDNWNIWPLYLPLNREAVSIRRMTRGNKFWSALAFSNSTC